MTRAKLATVFFVLALTLVFGELGPFGASGSQGRGSGDPVKRAEIEDQVAALTTSIAFAPQAWAPWCHRGAARQQLGDNAGAVSDLTRGIELAPEPVAWAFAWRGASRAHLRDLEGAARDLVKAIDLDPSTPWPWDYLMSVRLGQGDVASALSVRVRREGHSGVSPFVAGMAIAGAGAFVCFVALLLAGRKQQREARGSFLRLFGVSAAAAVLSASPLLVAAASHLNASPRATSDPVALAGTYLALVAFVGLVRPPGAAFAGRTSEALPAEYRIAARVHTLAHALGIPTPRIQILRAVGLEMNAWAGGLQAPSIAVLDGIVHRLGEAECDAILAHELGHLSPGSLWLLGALAPWCALAATMVSAFVPFAPAFTFMMLAFTGLRRIVGRAAELGCDRVGARAVGAATMARALGKIHAEIEIPPESWLSFLIYATAAHPSRDARAAALRSAAPEAERGAIVVDEQAARSANRGARFAFVAWLGAIVGGSMLARGSAPYLASGVFLAVASVPWLLMRAAIWRSKRRARLRVKSFRESLAQRVFVSSLIVVLATTFDTTRAWFPMSAGRVTACYFSALAVCLVSAVSMFLTSRRRRVVLEALLSRDYAGTIAAARAMGRAFERDPVLRHNVALALALEGRRDEALAELERVQSQIPGASIFRAMILLERDPTEALEAARVAEARLPGDSGPLIVSAQALLLLARPEEARAAIKRAHALQPASGTILAVAARIALALGDLEKARIFAADASDRSPGNVHVQIALAELALATEQPGNEQACAAVAAARAAADANPTAFCNASVERLEQRLGSGRM